MSGHFSERFASAARTEQKRLERRRARLGRKHDGLTRELKELDQRITEVVGLATAEPNPDSNGLRGRQIREVAVALLRQDRGTAPIHYRDWLRLVESHGHKIAGQRADSVFLSQVMRSPEVRATTSRGFYQLAEPKA